MSVTTRQVRLLHLLSAAGPQGAARDTPLPSPPALVRLLGSYQHAATSAGAGPTVVVCRTGVKGCGLFLACSFALNHLSEEQELDVVMAVATVQRSRPQFISTLSQLELVYDVALWWLEAFATYSNFQ